MGKLPFDRSSNDLTRTRCVLFLQHRRSWTESRTRHRWIGRRFLINHQQSDGSWLPLWFGNQDREDESNPIYGTAKVLAAAVHFLDDSAVDARRTT